MAPILEQVRPFTMISDAWLTDLARMVHTVITHDVRGDFVECGVWRGGAAFLMAALLRAAGVHDRKVWLFDSFEGLPTPSTIDGPAARRYATETTSPYYYDNCFASLEDVQATATQLGLAPYVECVKGWFDGTLPAHRERVGPIALLRLDCDWYASMRCCLENLYDQLVDGSFVAIDDYYHLDGCALAIHEFFGERHLTHRIESFAGKHAGIERVSGAWPAVESYANSYQGAVFRKGGDCPWYDLRRAYLAAQDIATVAPAGASYILVDQGWLGDQLPGGRRAVSLLGGSRQHSRVGDREVLRAVENHRDAGVAFLVFAWPVYWWLANDAPLGRQLRTRFRCVLENDRVTAFDLRR